MKKSLLVLVVVGFAATGLAAPRLGLLRGVPAETDCFLGAGAIAADHNARAVVTWQDDALEIQIECSVKEGHPPQALGRETFKTEMFGGETMEVMLAPHANDLTRYYHIAVNVSNLVYMAARRDQSWTPAREITVRQGIADGKWTAVFRVPFGAFGEEAVSEGTIWRAQFGAWRLDWCSIDDWHAPEKWGSLEFGKKPAEAVVESVVQGADGKQRIVFAVSRTGTLDHKGATFDDFTLLSRGKEIASRQTKANLGDAEWVTLDKYYYPSDDLSQIKWSAKGFVGAKATVRRLSERDRVLEIDDGMKRTSCQFEVMDVDAVARDRGTAGTLTESHGGFVAKFEDGYKPFFPVITSTEEWGSFTIQPVFDEWYARCPTGTFALDGATEYYGAWKNLAKAPRQPLAIYRIAYEIQSERRYSTHAHGEVLGAANNVEFYTKAYETVKAKYPDRLFSIHLDRAKDSSKFDNVGDIVEYASFSSSYAGNMLPNLEKTIDEAIGVAKWRSYVLWLGAAVPDRGLYRTAEELNTGVRLAIMKGAAGVVFHNGHGGVPKERARLWSLMRGIEAEVAEWYPAWKNGIDETLVTRIDDSVRAQSMRTVNGYLVLAVNLGYSEAGFNYYDPVAKENRSVKLPGAGSVLIEIKKER